MGNKMHSSRQDRKTKKRAAENQIPNLPDGIEHQDETPAMEAEHLNVQAKKRKREKNNHAIDKDDEVNRKKIKSEKKRAKKAAKENRLRDENENVTTEVLGTGTEAEKQVETNEKFDTVQQINTDTESVAEKGVELKHNFEADEKEKKKKKKKKQLEELMSNEMQISDINMNVSTKLNLEEDKSKSVDDNLTRKKSKKERKAERRAANAIATQQDSPKVTTNCEKNVYPTKTVLGNENVDLLEESQEILPDPSSSSSPRSSRFIVFVGNLPFTATTASIAAHFAKLKPCAVRNLTQKEDPNKSRGIAFVEFENFDTHKTALKTMHHSIFNDGQSEPRKINVELTAGGGGNKDRRKDKIKIKNDRLNEQRVRRTQEEEKAKLLKSPLGVTSLGKDAIHPSRRNMISV